MSDAPVHPLLALVPARSGSKGLPDKNVLSFAGIPLLAHAVQCARASGVCARVVVSTDSQAVAELACAHGADVPFLRPAELATDDAPILPVVQHAIEAVETADGCRYEAVLLLQPTSPLRLPDDIVAAARLLAADREADGVIAVNEPEVHPHTLCALDRRGYLEDLVPGASALDRRQEAPPVYRINGLLYLWRRDFVLAASNWRSGRLRPYDVPAWRGVDIDDRETFRAAESVVTSGRLSLPWCN
ncbi:MAG: cytidylyltransferase domain-containing protein [Gemmatimonadaceae bacterium]